MDKKFFSGTVFGVALGIGLSFVTPIISQPIDIKINGKNTSTSTKSNKNVIYSTKKEDKSDPNAQLNQNLEKMLMELQELNDKNKEALKYLKSIDTNTKYQNPYGNSGN